MEALEYDKLSEAKDLRAASFSAKQAESIVGTVSRAMRINQQIARDLASLKARVDNDMATKADLERFATKADLERFATKADLEGFATKADLERFATKADLERFATKADLEGFATKADLEGFATKSDFRDLRSDTRDGLTELRSEMLQGFGRLHRMLVSGMVSMSILMAAVAAGIATVASLIIQIR